MTSIPNKKANSVLSSPLVLAIHSIFFQLIIPAEFLFINFSSIIKKKKKNLIKNLKKCTDNYCNKSNEALILHIVALDINIVYSRNVLESILIWWLGGGIMIRQVNALVLIDAM